MKVRAATLVPLLYLACIAMAALACAEMATGDGLAMAPNSKASTIRQRGLNGIRTCACQPRRDVARDADPI
ncbi:hypothetical protein [Mycetohabitans sp. B46]|uniref:hypothetical protein n=1 Tax=Mycetohabitans sp. B46 TaxID=2772536 RepID=UPI00307F99F4